MIKLVWITPHADQIIGDCARVSSQGNEGKDPTRLIEYMIKHKHWSPFEMASACFEINTTRSITHQILRHRSFSFQEFSQRYSDASLISGHTLCRVAAEKNRQSSELTHDLDLITKWNLLEDSVSQFTYEAYLDALEIGVAKEVARVLLPEGLTRSRLYMTGTIRSWIHYLALRCAEDTQLEHRSIAMEIKRLLWNYIPITLEAVERSKE